MHWRIVCSFVVLFVLADAQRSARRRQWEDTWKKTTSDNLIDIDLETERNSVDQAWPEGDEVGGSGNGADSVDDEDLLTSGSGSGDGARDPTGMDRPPVANAGPDVYVHLPNNMVMLCGNRSSDDQSIVSYQWIKKSNMLSADMMGVRTVCLQLSSLQVGAYTFTLIVTDSGGNKAASDIRVYVEPGTSPDPLTPCQEMREASKLIITTFVPRCTDDGDYDGVQCRGHPGTSTCWCADLVGREIPGTAKQPPNIPDCEEGDNLPPCVFMLVRQLRQGLPGAFKPRCTLEGYFQAKQCSGSMCYCVHSESGVKIPNTEITLPDSPDCDGSSSPDPLTPCEEMREASKHIYTNFVPRCTDDGNYDSLQCRGHPGTSTCWCTDLVGREIPGTAKQPPDIPDCDKGDNLPPCVFMLMRQLRQGLPGAFKPKCTLEGYFQAKQCFGSVCYCVHTETGTKIPNTEVTLPNSPSCDGSVVRPTHGRDEDKVNLHLSDPKTPAPEVEMSTKVDVNIEKGDKGTDSKKPAVSNESASNKGGDLNRPPSSAAHIMTQPGILAAIIGGSVVLLLCAILLVMFVVYRMRKKDEGSYALEEPKKMPNYSYQRAPDKEFYA